MVNDLYFGISFVFCLILLSINLLVVTKFIPFPKVNGDLKETKNELIERTITAKNSCYLAGACLVLFGFTSVSTFNIFVTWIPHFAQQVIGMGAAVSVRLVSLYSVFSFVSVLTTSFLVKKWVKPMYLVLGYTAGACLTLFALAYSPSVATAYLAAFGVGFFATGGVWQLGLTKLLALFPNEKGKVTSYYSFLTSISVMIMPYITGQLQLEQIMKFNGMVTFSGVILTFITIVCIERPLKSLLSVFE